eukprot:93237-Prorocentrum_minimum.AAC.3
MLAALRVLQHVAPPAGCYHALHNRTADVHRTILSHDTARRASRSVCCSGLLGKRPAPLCSV